MGRRRGQRRPRDPAPAAFAGALSKIDTMERAAMQRMLTPQFALQDVLYFLLPHSVVEALQVAWPHANKPYQMQWWAETDVVIPGELHGGITCNLFLNCEAAHIVCPAGPVTLNEHFGKNVLACLHEAHAIFTRFEQVRSVIHWLNDHATPGAARYYFPGICSLLPPDHVVHRADGLRYKEPAANVAEIIPAMREAATTVAMGVLLGEVEAPPNPGNFSVEFARNDDTNSNRFHILHGAVTL